MLSIDTELLAVPDSDYDVTIRMSSSELTRICKDLLAIGDSVTISATKGEVKFAANGDLGTGNITLKSRDSIDEEVCGCCKQDAFH